MKRRINRVDCEGGNQSWSGTEWDNCIRSSGYKDMRLLFYLRESILQQFSFDPIMQPQRNKTGPIQSMKSCLEHHESPRELVYVYSLNPVVSLAITCNSFTVQP